MSSDCSPNSHILHKVEVENHLQEMHQKYKVYGKKQEDHQLACRALLEDVDETKENTDSEKPVKA